MEVSSIENFVFFLLLSGSLSLPAAARDTGQPRERVEHVCSFVCDLSPCFERHLLGTRELYLDPVHTRWLPETVL